MLGFGSLIKDCSYFIPRLLQIDMTTKDEIKAHQENKLSPLS